MIITHFPDKDVNFRIPLKKKAAIMQKQIRKAAISKMNEHCN